MKIWIMQQNNLRKNARVQEFKKRFIEKNKLLNNKKQQNNKKKEEEREYKQKDSKRKSSGKIKLQQYKCNNRDTRLISSFEYISGEVSLICSKTDNMRTPVFAPSSKNEILLDLQLGKTLEITATL